MKISQITIGFLTLTLCSSLSFCTPGHLQMSSDTLRMALGSDPPQLDPALADTGVSVSVLKQVLTTLLAIDSTGKIVAADAETFDWIKKGQGLRVVVREGLKWSDGVDLKVCQFRDGWLHALDPKTPSTLADIFYDIRGAEEFKKGLIDSSKVGIQCDDAKRELLISLKSPFPFKILYALTFIVSAPWRSERYQMLRENWVIGDQSHPAISTGAYVIMQWQHDRRIKLQSRSSLGEKALSPDRQAHIAHIDLPIIKDATTALSMYESGSLDVLEEIPAAFLSKLTDRRDRQMSSSLTTYYVGFSLNSNPVLKNLKVRQALAFSAGQPEVPQLLRGGEIEAKSWVPPELVVEASRVKVSLYQIDLAKKLLDEAGFLDRKKFPILKLQYNSGERHQLLMERLAYRWKNDLGIRVELSPVEWKAHVAQLKLRPPDLFRYAWTAVYPDALFFLGLFRSYSLNNFGGWKNSQFDALIKKLSQVAIEKRSSDYYKELSLLENILTVQDPALIPIYHYVRNTLVKPHLKNFGWDFRGVNLYKDAQIVTEK